jgi:hypothetical protein
LVLKDFDKIEDPSQMIKSHLTSESYPLLSEIAGEYKDIEIQTDNVDPATLPQMFDKNDP